MAEYYLYSTCDDKPRTPVTPPPDPKPSGGLPDGGQPGQVLGIDDNGNPSWVTGGGGGGSVTLYNTTGQSTTGGMTQKAITDELEALQTLVGGLQTQITTLQNRLAEYEDVRLQMTDGTNTTEYMVLGKQN